MTKVKLSVIALILLVVVSIGFGIYYQMKNQKPSQQVAVGQPVPAYAAYTLNEETVDLADYKGKKAVLVNVWATWCDSCREEMSGIQKLYEEYRGQGLEVIGVSIDDEGANRQVRAFINNLGVTFPILRDPGEHFTRTFRTVGVPETFLIDKESVLGGLTR